MDRKIREAVRYLGYGREQADEKTLDLINEAFEDLERIAEKRIVCSIFPLECDGEERIEIGNLKISSKSLAKNLKECDQVILLGATLGIQVDLLMKRYSLTHMAKAVVLQACASALLEAYLDEWQSKKAEEMKKMKLYLRPRFSPGYGDFSVLHQKEILKMLEAQKKIGLMITESSMLTPTKSVTALIGIGRRDEGCSPQGCEVCSKADCRYRRT